MNIGFLLALSPAVAVGFICITGAVVAIACRDRIAYFKLNDHGIEMQFKGGK